MGAGIDKETLDATLAALHEFAARNLADATLLDLDRRDEFPEAIVRDMCGAGLGIQLFFIPEEYHGMGGGVFDLYRICEAMGHLDVGVATGVLATFLGSDPIVVGGTPEQKTKYMTRIADEGILMAYGATEPQAGSDLAALRTTAVPVEENGKVVGYRIGGAKQWISNGGVADVYTILANAPGGPSWFIVERGTPGLSAGKPEDKHGIRLSNTAALSLDEVYVPAENLVGGVEGQGLAQAQAVFGYTRLMVAGFGLGAGWAALDRAVPYSTTRIQGGSPLSEKPGYTHKLIVANVIRLEAARAYMEYVARRLDEGDQMLNTEGAIAKYMATEAGNRAAEASIQALGGYGYTREYMVEKIKRDVRITTIYEGTSEIMEMTISRDRWQAHLKTRGQHYHEAARGLEAIRSEHPNTGCDVAALALHALAEVLERCRIGRLTRHQHVLFRIGELVAFAECAEQMARRAVGAAAGTLNPKTDTRFDPAGIAAISRCFAREAAAKIARDGLGLAVGGGAVADAEVPAFEAALGLPAIHRAQAGLLADMDAIADLVYGRGGGASAAA
ncbi:acyl-CoA dehydrogenase family protein [Candidatus Binatia bacterium]|nr:acyl-CoA dehydrogenase family protein [Candidatus Binatia bacterium]